MKDCEFSLTADTSPCSFALHLFGYTGYIVPTLAAITSPRGTAWSTSHHQRPLPVKAPRVVFLPCFPNGNYFHLASWLSASTWPFVCQSSTYNPHRPWSPVLTTSPKSVLACRRQLLLSFSRMLLTPSPTNRFLMTVVKGGSCVPFPGYES